MEEYATLASPAPEMRTLEKVGITVSSNIHLNSFMYEPILDLTIDHLIELYKEVCGLSEGKGVAHADKRPGHGGVRGA